MEDGSVAEGFAVPGLTVFVALGAVAVDFVRASGEDLIQGRCEFGFVRLAQISMMRQLDNGLVSLGRQRGLIKKR